MSAHLNLHRPPINRPSISPRLTYPLTVRVLRRNNSATSQRVSKRSPIGGAALCCLPLTLISPPASSGSSNSIPVSESQQCDTWDLPSSLTLRLARLLEQRPYPFLPQSKTKL